MTSAVPAVPASRGRCVKEVSTNPGVVDNLKENIIVSHVYIHFMVDVHVGGNV